MHLNAVLNPHVSSSISNNMNVLTNSAGVSAAAAPAVAVAANNNNTEADAGDIDKLANSEKVNICVQKHE